MHGVCLLLWFDIYLTCTVSQLPKKAIECGIIRVEDLKASSKCDEYILKMGSCLSSSHNVLFDAVSEFKNNHNYFMIMYEGDGCISALHSNLFVQNNDQLFDYIFDNLVGFSCVRADYINKNVLSDKIGSHSKICIFWVGSTATNKKYLHKNGGILAYGLNMIIYNTIIGNNKANPNEEIDYYFITIAGGWRTYMKAVTLYPNGYPKYNTYIDKNVNDINNVNKDIFKLLMISNYYFCNVSELNCTISDTGVVVQDKENEIFKHEDKFDNFQDKSAIKKVLNNKHYKFFKRMIDEKSRLNGCELLCIAPLNDKILLNCMVKHSKQLYNASVGYPGQSGLQNAKKHMKKHFSMSKL